jgi:hypothetical protein
MALDAQRNEEIVMASSIDIWAEARRRCRNHLRAAFVERGMNPTVVAKMDMEKQVDDLMKADGGEYLRVAFVRLNVEIGDEAE